MSFRVDRCHHDPEIRRLCPGQGPPHTFRFHGIFRLTQPRRIGHRHRQAGKLHPRLDHIARRPRFFRDNGRFPPAKPIEEGGFADIRRADNRNLQPPAHQLAPVAIGEHRFDLRFERAQTRQNGGAKPSAHIPLFFPEIDIGFHIGAHGDKPRAPIFRLLLQRSGHLAQRLFALACRFRVDEIGKALDFRQIEAPVLESPPREGAPLGRRQARKPRQRAEHRLHHRAPAMDMQLGDIFAGKTRRTFEKEHQRLIEPGPGFRIAQPPQHRLARRARLPAAQLFYSRACARPRNPDHRHPAFTWRCRERKDRFHSESSPSRPAVPKAQQPQDFRNHFMDIELAALIPSDTYRGGGFLPPARPL